MQEFEWRCNEIILLKNMVNSCEKEEYIKLILKMSIPIIYAHLEGFIVSACKIILEYLNTLKLSSNDYSEKFIMMAFDKDIKSLSGSQDLEKKIKHFCRIQEKLLCQLKFETKVNVKSNLTFEVLENLCLKFDISSVNFKDYKDILNQLVNIRNAIAHGENSYSFESFADIEKYIELFEALCLDFSKILFNILEDKKYKKEK
ncbi:hypothetical protein Q5U91_000978 [Campylobacter jejuni]|uniref:RiboL-PSP-HEPN domain-containing protein n=1 Tax=Campylobacter jejuni TaxID=197 RepID=A0A5T0Q7Y4_CAMJU|nr:MULTISPECIES: MAE_28990/MAE_18760 family HEPN-like nuclease [Campylobacter]EAH9042125.1 hypothetical protein [Campylobacter jejuni]EAH9698692.1 hypothetical protein [Campylobacter jejuni]EAI0696392.1 hypothetical protein [Campylobacter jejuni]EAI2839454.1 hypothetical protein [Campylobacter jejuni]EAI2865706.1 hypothetical protein [Campylobacter jejuni]